MHFQVLNDWCFCAVFQLSLSGDWGIWLSAGIFVESFVSLKKEGVLMGVENLVLKIKILKLVVQELTVENYVENRS
ncbi:hypothetical protein [Corynebacterium freiburgense]|uniref:hypothetical protein n=1 Tax=Corynebacterium freiburgense TaxID=556548 RepID=UPI00047D7881|nr:hypothetical protein [Corynebacterium freiburgense]